MTTRPSAFTFARTRCLVLLAVILSVLAFPSSAHAAGTTTLASANAAGTNSGNTTSFSPVISADGTTVAFQSYASNLGPTDTNGRADVLVRDLTTGVTTLASVNAAGTNSGDGESGSPVISADGSMVAFQSTAGNFGPVDIDGDLDVYVRDLTTGQTTLASANAAGTDGGDGESLSPVISADGTTVAFSSRASNLVPADTDGDLDVYVRDLTTGQTSLASANAAGTGSGNSHSFRPVISADGTTVAFQSIASDLGPTDDNRTYDVYVRDVTAGRTTLASVNAAGTNSGTDFSWQPAISADGTTVAFWSGASDLGPTDDNGTYDVYVRDLTAGRTTLASVNAAGTNSGNLGSSAPAISADGATVAFQSTASDLDPVDTDGALDLYVRDLATGETTLASVNADVTDSGDGESFSPVISADGTMVAFQSTASNLGPINDTNGTADVYVRDLAAGVTTLASVNAAGTDSGNGESYMPVMSADGTTVAFPSLASNLGPTDTNFTADVYVRDLGEAVMAVQIDIKPGTFPNDVKPGGKGKMPVAILGTPSFDASTVDSGSVRFGATGTETTAGKSSLKDADADGDIDMILQFEIKNTGIACGDTSASLTGETLSGSAIEASDSVKTVGCR